MARKPLDGTVAANVLAHGTGGINVAACRIGTKQRFNPPSGGSPDDDAVYGLGMRGAGEGTIAEGRWPANVILSHLPECEMVSRVDELRKMCKSQPSGGSGILGSQLHGSIAVDPVRVSREVYRCAPGCAVAALDAQVPASKSSKAPGPRGTRAGGFGNVGADRGSSVPNGPQYEDSGGPSRYFYCAKPSTRERDAGLAHLPTRTGGEATDREDGSAGVQNPRAGAGRGGGRRNFHPTVKPIALMRWLVRLVTPPNGVVLDPFTGSGTTGVAALAEGFRFVGTEMTDEYIPITEGRLRAALKGEI